MLVKVRSVVGMVMIWLATVAGVSVTAWVAIDRAGQDVTGAAVSSLPLATVGGAAAPTTPASGAQPKPSEKPEPSTTRKPSVTPQPSKSTTPAPPTSPATARDRTVRVAGGQISVRCTGATIRLRIAQPDNGWRVEVEHSGPAEIEVSFQRGDDDAGSVTHVTAVCATGTPAFKVENTD